MARKKVVKEKNYYELIKASEERIETLTVELKEEKANLKQLEKDKKRYDAMMEEKRKQEETKEIAELIASSGKSIEEIKKFLLN